MKRVFLSVFLILAIGALVVGCSGSGSGNSSAKSKQGEGLGAAYAALEKADVEGVTYDEETDALIVDMNAIEDVNELFDILDENVNGADIGTLSFGATKVDIDPRNYKEGNKPKTEYAPLDCAEDVSERVGALPCKSIQCLDMGVFYAYAADGEWTEILDRTYALYSPYFVYFEDYPSFAQENLGQVEALWLDAGQWSGYGYRGVELMTGIEEIRFTAGLTTAEREESAKTKGGVSWNENLEKMLAEQKNLERILFFPELDKWSPGESYPITMGKLQLMMPDMKTNALGKAWDGDDESLISIRDVDVLSMCTTEDTMYEYERTLREQAKVAFETGKSFTLKEGQPKLGDGTCIVYLGDPHDSEWNDYSKLFTRTSFVMVDEFAGTKVQMPRSAANFDYFVYIYPTFELRGMYGDTTEAYATLVHVRVYDMKNKEIYESGVITTVEPADTYYYSYKPEPREWPNIDKEAAIKYIDGLV